MKQAKKGWRRMEPLERRQLLAGDPIDIGRRSFDVAMQTAVDAQGNKIVAGIFGGQVDFDPGDSQVNLTSKGETDLFVAKYTSAGALVWVRQYGGSSGELDDEQLYDTSQATVGEFENLAGPIYDGLGEFVNDLVLGDDGSIVFAGSFMGTADFIPLNPNKGNKRSAGYHDAFVCKLDSDGNTHWASTFSGVFNDVAKGVAIDGAGNVIVTGYFTRSADLNPGQRTLKIDAIGRDDAFVVKLFGATGGLDWAVTTGGDGVDLKDRDSGEGIAVDENNNIYVTGSFAGWADFAPGKGTFNLKADSRSDAFIWVLSPKGKMHRAQSFGGGRWDAGIRIEVGSDNAIFVAGYFSEEADLDPTIETQYFTAVEPDDFEGRDTDIFVMRMNADTGNPSWIRQIQGDGYEWLGELKVSGGNEAYIVGGYSGQLSFLDEIQLTSVLGDDDFEDDRKRDYSYDIFAAKLTAAGDSALFQSFGSTGDDFGTGLSLNATGVTISGRFKGTVDFAPGSAVNNVKSKGNDDGFVLDLTDELR